MGCKIFLEERDDILYNIEDSKKDLKSLSYENNNDLFPKRTNLSTSHRYDSLKYSDVTVLFSILSFDSPSFNRSSDSSKVQGAGGHGCFAETEA